MTSTNFTVGLDGTRVSSKVIKPPGGGSSDIFGLGTTQHSHASNDESKKEHPNTQNRLFGSTTDSKSSAVANKNLGNMFANENQASLSSKKQYVRRNPITGEGIEYPSNEKSESDVEKEDEMQNNSDVDNDKKREKSEVEIKPQAPTKVIQTSIRVRNPPGGKSSGIF